ANPNTKNYEGLTPLHQCCIDGNIEMAKLFLQNGSYVNATDMDRWTPLHAAATCGHKDLAECLLQNGADLLAANNDDDMPFMITEDKETLDFLQKEMMYQGITNQMVKNKKESTYSNMKHDILNLLKNNESLDISVTEDGASFLHVAIAQFYNDLVQLLLKHNASQTTTDNEGWRPIHVAAYWGNKEALKLLVKNYKVDTEVKTNNGETPYDLCDKEIKNYLINLVKKNQPQKRLSLRETSQILDLDFLHLHLVTKKHEKNELDHKSQHKNTSDSITNSPKLQRRSSDDLHSLPILNFQVSDIALEKRNSVRDAKKNVPNKRFTTSESIHSFKNEDIEDTTHSYYKENLTETVQNNCNINHEKEIKKSEEKEKSITNNHEKEMKQSNDEKYVSQSEAISFQEEPNKISQIKPDIEMPNLQEVHNSSPHEEATTFNANKTTDGINNNNNLQLRNPSESVTNLSPPLSNDGENYITTAENGIILINNNNLPPKERKLSDSSNEKLKCHMKSKDEIEKVEKREKEKSKTASNEMNTQSLITQESKLSDSPRKEILPRNSLSSLKEQRKENRKSNDLSTLFNEVEKDNKIFPYYANPNDLDIRYTFRQIPADIKYESIKKKKCCKIM
ncbi:Protein phosphatase 1 regulatory subunit 16A, partial [Armadillidium nasatum]